MTQNMKDLKEIVALFATEGEVIDIRPLGSGLINDTYFVETSAGTHDYVLQRINNAIFQDVELLQNNIESVTRHIRRKLEAADEKDIHRKVLHFVPAIASGKTYAFADGKYWRISVFINDADTFQAVNPEYSEYAGEAFGDFEAKLADIPDKLGETIPDFHNMELRLRQLVEAVKNDAAGRLKGEGKEELESILAEIDANAEDMCLAEQLHREGKLPKRICHCDTKVNNMLFDKDGSILCVIDLDTVMPNFIFSDYGDFLRTGANRVAEDHPNMAEVQFDIDIFKAFTEGYLSSAKSFLLPVEIENLPYATALFPYMQCVRFLWDYLSGDKYWKVKYPNHNFVRANNQLHLLLSIEQHWDEMKQFIQSKL